jgi:hypothetical protein
MTVLGGLVRWLKLSTLVLLLTICISESPHQAFRGSTANGSHARGTVEDVEHLRRYSALHLRLLLAFARLPAHIAVENGTDLYRVSYWTQHLDRPELASGLLALPRGRAPRATVMWLNGTNPTRSEAPSMRSTTGLFVSASFAGSGFLLLAPDYVGLGLSKTYHPYLYAETTAESAIDFVRAAQSVCARLGVPWRPALLLVGYSEGGYATAVVQRAFEKAPQSDVSVRGAAALAPPLNLADISVPRAFEGQSGGDSMYLAFLANAYANTYGHPLKSILTDDAARLVSQLFDGLHSADDIMAKLPKNPREMFRPDTLAAFSEDRASWFRDALRANEAYQWAPQAPLRLYYGDRDVDVYPDDPKRGAKGMESRGGNVSLVPVGPYDHTGVVLHAVPRVQAWFKQLAP